MMACQSSSYVSQSLASYTLRLLWLIAVVRATTYANSSDLCVKLCACSSSHTTLTIDCEGKGMRHTIANWPHVESALADSDYDRLIASFSHNVIKTLETLPTSAVAHIEVAFANCSIEFIESGLFESMPNVVYADLSHNLLESSSLSEQVFKGPYNATAYEPINLEHLDLSYNRLHTLPKRLFKHTPKLRYLNLEGNGMRIIDQITCLALAAIPQLATLNLARNQLTEVPSDALRPLHALQHCNLSYNDLDFIPRALGYVAHALHTLDISYNPMVELELADFDGMDNLTQLWANNLTELTRIKTRTFIHLSNLQELHLEHNHRLWEIDASAFDNVQHLQRLFLYDNALEHLPPDLINWDALHEFDVRHNHLVCTCALHNISQRLPLRIRRNSNVPYCRNPRTTLSENIYTLRGACVNDEGARDADDHHHQNNDARATFYALVGANGSLLKVAFVANVALFILVSIIVVWLSYLRCYRNRSSEPTLFETQVRYNRLPNQM